MNSESTGDTHQRRMDYYIKILDVLKRETETELKLVSGRNGWTTKELRVIIPLHGKIVDGCSIQTWRTVFDSKDFEGRTSKRSMLLKSNLVDLYGCTNEECDRIVMNYKWYVESLFDHE